MIEIKYMNLSINIQVSDLLILSNYLLCSYLHSLNKCIVDYLTKLWYHARIMQERDLGEKVYFCIDTSFFLYSYTTWKVAMTHERSHLFTWVSVEQTSVVIIFYIKKEQKKLLITELLTLTRDQNPPHICPSQHTFSDAPKLKLHDLGGSLVWGDLDSALKTNREEVKHCILLCR
jgi:hypothetical protein